MTREEAINEINKVFTSAYANYIVTALTEGATVSDIQHRWGRAYEAGVKDGLEQKPCEDVVSRSEVKKIAKEMYLEVANMELDAKTISDCISSTSSKCREVLERKLQALQPVQPKSKTGHWVKEESPFGWDGHSYQCSECGRSIHLDTMVEDLTDYPYCHCGADMREGK